MHARFRVGRRGRTYVEHETAWRVAQERGATVWLVVGSRAVLQLPNRFTLQENIGSIVYSSHADGTGRWWPGPGYPNGRLMWGEPHIRIDYATHEIVLTQRSAITPHADAPLLETQRHAA